MTEIQMTNNTFHKSYTYTYEQVRQENILLDVGDIVIFNRVAYYVSERTYEALVSAPVIVKYNLQQLQGTSAFHYDPFQPSTVTLEQELTSDMIRKYNDTHTTHKEIESIEEISEETRREFIKLLK